MARGGDVSTGDIRVRPIGVVHTSASKDEVKEGKGGMLSEIEVFLPFEPALDGLEGFSHIFVLGYLNQLRPEQIGPLKVQPRGLLRLGLKPEELPTVGVFALDSPTRPNPVSLSLAPVVRRQKNVLTVSDLDLFDLTPVLDMKPYQSSYRTDSYKVPEWHARLLRKAGRV